MAIGDKKPVVMESDKGVAGGVATLGADGILSEAERPFADQLYLPSSTSTVDEALTNKADLTLSNLTDQSAALQNLGLTATAEEINHLSGVTSSVQEQLDGKANLLLSNLPDKPTALYNIGAAVRPNLLDNAHFYSPNLIDQRQGYVVPPGVQSYQDTALSLPHADVTGSYYTVEEMTSTYAKFTFTNSGAAAYVPVSAAVRGYVGGGYGIDRWYNAAGIVELVNNDAITLINTRTDARIYFRQTVEPFTAGTYTFSVLLESGELVYGTKYIDPESMGNSYIDVQSFSGNTLRVEHNLSTGATGAIIVVGAGLSIHAVAAKLEEGEGQTLARQLEDGSWEIIDQQDAALNLMKCQRHFRRFGSNVTVYGVALTGFISNSNKDVVIEIPEMRAVPTATITGKIFIRGILGYVADDNGDAALECYVRHASRNTLGISRPEIVDFLNVTNNTPVSIGLPIGSYIEIDANL